MLPAPAISLQGRPGCRCLRSADRRRDASEMISRQRVTAYSRITSSRKVSNAWSTVKCWASVMLWRMSCSADRSRSERIDGVPCCGLAQMRLQRIAVDHVDRPIEQAADVVLDPDIVEDGYSGL